MSITSVQWLIELKNYFSTQLSPREKFFFGISYAEACIKWHTVIALSQKQPHLKCIAQPTALTLGHWVQLLRHNIRNIDLSKKCFSSIEQLLKLRNETYHGAYQPDTYYQQRLPLLEKLLASLEHTTYWKPQPNLNSLLITEFHGVTYFYNRWNRKKNQTEYLSYQIGTKLLSISNSPQLEEFFALPSAVIDKITKKWIFGAA